MNEEKIIASTNPNFNSESLVDLVQVGQMLTSTFDLDEILQLIMEKVSQLVQAENWSLLLKDEETEDLTFKVVVGSKADTLKGLTIPPGEGIAGYVACSGKAEFISDAQNDPRLFRIADEFSGFTTNSIACIPLNSHDVCLGVIEIVNIDDMKNFKKNELPALIIFANYAAIAIENSRYFSRIQKMSITDEYTGLYNVRYLYDFLGRVISESALDNTDAAAVFIDIDNFKKVVDEYGHLKGSQILKEIGETILGCISDDDILAKYGGDEYVIILPGKGKEAARKVIKKVQQEIRSTDYLISIGQPVKITASFGIATFSEDAHTVKGLLLAADRQMYRIKNTTKDGIGISD
ncbi:MAG: sensor domain-containing diguanylate cyclase [Candidatus Auribacterota bacterium]|nr:sensor domain-containing diguanylate cyclase [Candidatus Auribacterota bacterium]